MYNEHSGIFFSTIGEPEHPYMLIKLPQVTLKSVYSGCQIDIAFSPLNIDNRKYFTCGLIVWDDLISPLVTYQLVKSEDEFNSIRECMSKELLRVHFFDELVRPIVSASSRINSRDMYSCMNNIYDFIDVNNDDNIYEEYKIQVETCIQGKESNCKILKLGLHFEEPTRIYVPLAGKFSINDKDEGGGLENSIFHLIEEFYGFENSIKGPLLNTENKRELTDILAWDEHQVCFIESKCLSILDRGNIDKEKRIKNIKSHLKKALNQLEGAVKTYRRNEMILNEKLEIVNIPHDRKHGVIDCIVLISEMYPFLEWNEIAKELMVRSKNVGAFFHIFDLSELQRLVAISKSTLAWNANLFMRWEKIKEMQNAFIRSEVMVNEKNGFE